MLRAGCIYLDLSPPAQNLPPPVQLQMPSELKITQNVQPD